MKYKITEYLDSLISSKTATDTKIDINRLNRTEAVLLLNTFRYVNTKQKNHLLYEDPKKIEEYESQHTPFLLSKYYEYWGLNPNRYFNRSTVKNGSPCISCGCYWPSTTEDKELPYGLCPLCVLHLSTTQLTNFFEIAKCENCGKPIVYTDSRYPLTLNFWYEIESNGASSVAYKEILEILECFFDKKGIFLAETEKEHIQTQLKSEKFFQDSLDSSFFYKKCGQRNSFKKYYSHIFNKAGCDISPEKADSFTGRQVLCDSCIDSLLKIIPNRNRKDSDRINLGGKIYNFRYWFYPRQILGHEIYNTDRGYMEFSYLYDDPKQTVLDVFKDCFPKDFFLPGFLDEHYPVNEKDVEGFVKFIKDDVVPKWSEINFSNISSNPEKYLRTDKIMEFIKKLFLKGNQEIENTNLEIIQGDSPEELIAGIIVEVPGLENNISCETIKKRLYSFFYSKASQAEVLKLNTEKITGSIKYYYNGITEFRLIKKLKSLEIEFEEGVLGVFLKFGIIAQLFGKSKTDPLYEKEWNL